ncbi:hypothetical protein SELMODRAFT_402927 [Selaginella moellendorffii]|uniref:Uncharacterized protein n=1 Tax=Selaginella moellendorffii TaxID=88036 RepID=D8QNH6_SELML|nr:hypothetical protein SELMODRAFT_402927 [Selaginella moellendorffii]
MDRLQYPSLQQSIVHPIRSAKFACSSSIEIKRLGLKCLKGKDSKGNHIKREVPEAAEVTRSRKLYPGKFEYPTLPSFSKSTKLLYKMVRLERGICALQQSRKTVEGAAVVSASFDDATEEDLATLLKDGMDSQVKRHLPRLFGLAGYYFCSHFFDQHGGHYSENTYHFDHVWAEIQVLMSQDAVNADLSTRTVVMTSKARQGGIGF